MPYSTGLVGGGKRANYLFIFFALLFKSQLTVLHTHNLILMTAQQKHRNAEESGKQRKSVTVVTEEWIPTFALRRCSHSPCHSSAHSPIIKSLVFPVRASTHCKCKCLTLAASFLWHSKGERQSTPLVPHRLRAVGGDGTKGRPSLCQHSF